MSLRYALLALLTAGPLTGYDAAKRFNGSVGHVWHAPDSQIYPELRRMQKDGLIEGQQVRWGPRSTKTQYEITDGGLAAFRTWMNTPLDHAPERDATTCRPPTSSGPTPTGRGNPAAAHRVLHHPGRVAHRRPGRNQSRHGSGDRAASRPLPGA